MIRIFEQDLQGLCKIRINSNNYKIYVQGKIFLLRYLNQGIATGMLNVIQLVINSKFQDVTFNVLYIDHNFMLVKEKEKNSKLKL